MMSAAVAAAIPMTIAPAAMPVRRIARIVFVLPCARGVVTTHPSSAALSEMVLGVDGEGPERRMPSDGVIARRHQRPRPEVVVAALEAEADVVGHHHVPARAGRPAGEQVLAAVVLV